MATAEHGTPHPIGEVIRELETLIAFNADLVAAMAVDHLLKRFYPTVSLAARHWVLGGEALPGGEASPARPGFRA